MIRHAVFLAAAALLALPAGGLSATAAALTAAAEAAPTAAAAEAPGGRVNVRYVDPAAFTDAALHGGRGTAARAPALDNIRAHLEGLGRRLLAPGQVLEVEVLDIDLAGRIEPWQMRAHDVRFMRDITWPRLTLRYRLRDGAALRIAAEEAVTDMSYLARPTWRYRSQAMPFEKAMLDRWFRARFVQGLAPPV